MHECLDCSEVYLSDGPRECSTCGTLTAAVESRDWATASGDVPR